MFAFASVHAADLIGIRADNSKETFTISNVMSIKFQNSTNPTMSINQNDGSSSEGFKKIVFSEGQGTSVNDNKFAASVSVYPNPVESIIYIDGLDADADIQVLDLNGKLLKQEKAQQIDVNDLQSGSYLLKIDNNSIKFIKK